MKSRKSSVAVRGFNAAIEIDHDLAHVPTAFKVTQCIRQLFECARGRAPSNFIMTLHRYQAVLYTGERINMMSAAPRASADRCIKGRRLWPLSAQPGDRKQLHRDQEALLRTIEGFISRTV